MLAPDPQPVKQGGKIVELPVALPASAGEKSAKQPASLERLTTLLESDLARVNKLIVDRMQSPVALIPQLAGHIVAAGGKRLRPMLTLAISRLCGYARRASHRIGDRG